MDPRIERVIALVKSDFRRKLDLDELAAACGLSVFTFSHLFKEQTGMSPLQYMKVLRLYEALRFLLKTTVSLKTIRYETGFEDRSHFSRDFKLFFGVAPSRVRSDSEFERDDEPPQEPPHK